jgi:hypothetical protein
MKLVESMIVLPSLTSSSSIYEKGERGGGHSEQVRIKGGRKDGRKKERLT